MVVCCVVVFAGGWLRQKGRGLLNEVGVKKEGSWLRPAANFTSTRLKRVIGRRLRLLQGKNHLDFFKARSMRRAVARHNSSISISSKSFPFLRTTHTFNDTRLTTPHTLSLISLRIDEQSPKMGSDTIDVDAPDAEQTQSAATFHYFCKLAPELRIKIWNAALPNARTIEITGDVLETLSDTARLVNLPKPPAIRGVCHEAWEITQKNWVHSLGLRYEEFGENFPGFWFDPDTDIILDWKRWNREFENGQFFERVRNLAICSRDVSLEENFDRVLDSFWDLLPNIRRLIIIIQRRCWSRW